MFKSKSYKTGEHGEECNWDHTSSLNQPCWGNVKCWFKMETAEEHHYWYFYTCEGHKKCEWDRFYDDEYIIPDPEYIPEPK